MYQEQVWRDGWLYTRSTPEGAWWPANSKDVIVWLAEKVAALEERLADFTPTPREDTTHAR